VLDGLQRRGELSLDDIAAVLAPSTAAGQTEARPPRTATGTEATKEEFRALSDVPVGAVLASDIELRDGNVFVRAGIVMSPLIISLLSHLESMKVLALSQGDGSGGKPGIYVRIAAAVADLAQSALPVIALGGRPRQVDVSDIPAGAIVARGIYTVDGNLYLPAGEQITPRVVSLLGDLKDLGKLNDKIWIVA
jgi:hypothetical protein